MSSTTILYTSLFAVYYFIRACQCRLRPTMMNADNMVLGLGEGVPGRFFDSVGGSGGGKWKVEKVEVGSSKNRYLVCVQCPWPAVLFCPSAVLLSPTQSAAALTTFHVACRASAFRLR